MNIKFSLVISSFLLASAAASAASPITINAADHTGSFNSTVSGAEFSFLVNAGDILDKITVSSTFNSKSSSGVAGTFNQTSGFDISQVFLDGNAIGGDLTPATAAIKTGKTWTQTDVDNWTFAPTGGQLFLAAGEHTIKVVGLSKVNGGFSGNLQITPVPEPQTYALLLAGLCAMGFVTRRQRQV